MLMSASINPTKKTFAVDRPFSYFLIYNKQNNYFDSNVIILFNGYVKEPISK